MRCIEYLILIYRFSQA